MKKLFLLSIHLFIILTSFSQRIVTDTLYIEFKPDKFIPYHFSVSEIIDNRQASPKFISYSRTRKLLLIPVDQEISTRMNFSVELKNSFDSVHQPKNNFAFDINYFLIDKYKGRFFNSYVLHADLAVHDFIDHSKNYIGTLSYNLPFKPKTKKLSKPEICEMMLNNWHRELKIDLISVSKYMQNQEKLPERLIVNKNLKPQYLNLNIGTVVGPQFWQIEGEIYFTRPETKNKFWTLSNIIRYQKNNELEMIGFGKKTEHFYYRTSENWTFDISSNFLLGLNKWSNDDNITLYQLFNFSISSTQSINFDKKNMAGWILKAGIYENFYYVVKKSERFQIGLYLSTGYKF